VDGCILTASELIALHQRGSLESADFSKLLGELKHSQTPEGAMERRSERVVLKLRLLVRAENHAGERLQEQAVTVDVNAHGGLLECPFRMTVGERITLINPETRKEVICRVLRVQSSASGLFATAFEFGQPSPWFWPVVRPPLDWAATPESG
jgi:hypothetical protein